MSYHKPIVRFHKGHIMDPIRRSFLHPVHGYVTPQYRVSGVGRVRELIPNERYNKMHAMMTGQYTHGQHLDGHTTIPNARYGKGKKNKVHHMSARKAIRKILHGGSLSQI